MFGLTLLILPNFFCNLYYSPLSKKSFHHIQTHTDKTPVAAYVDTGAQVTIISASAAKRAGIYHLIDRRYAGRATGVGHCKVLGRIPARHVYFILGEGCDEEQQDYDGWSDGGGYHPTDYRGGGDEQEYYQDHHHDDDDESISSSSMVQMDGPALTVLEGTVTQGVDVLLGLDVLQDWDAEIRMGPRKSITVNKRRGGGTAASSSGSSSSSSSVVIPFAGSSRSRRYPMRQEEGRRHHHHSARSTHHHHRHYQGHKTNSNHHYVNLSNFEEEEDFIEDDNEEEENDDDFSPTTSDIESDLDLLDQSGHEFPEDGCISSSSRQRSSAASSRQPIRSKSSLRDAEDDLLGDLVDAEEENDDDYLHDIDDEEEEEDMGIGMDDDDEDMFDMAGL